MRIDVLANPLSVVDELFQAHIIANPEDGLRESAGWGVPAHFDALLHEDNTINRVPSINFTNPDQLTPNSVVKFRCMIQDMFDPEYYIGVYEQRDTTSGDKAKKTGKYTDQINLPSNVVADISPYAPSTITYERLSLMCVPIPGETKWVKEHVAPTVENQPNESLPEASERASVKRGRDETKSQNGKSTMRSIDYAIDTSCVVLVYDIPDGAFKLNDTIEVVGILAPHTSRPPTIDEDMMDIPSTVATLPRVHCLTYRTITNAHPLLDSAIDWRPAADQVAVPHPLQAALQDPSSVREVRQQIISYLATGLGGDTLAAEFLLLFLLSKVYQRHGLLAMGKLSLNFDTHKMNKQAEILAPVPILPLATTIRNMCSALVPRCGSHSLTIDRLSKDTYIPRKDYSQNRLLPALLQLSDSTLLIIDESTMKIPETPMGEMVKINLGALNDLSQWQKLEYDFVYHKGEFQVDIPVLTVSHGKPGLTADCSVIIQSTTYAASVEPPKEFINLWRVYLSTLRNKMINHPAPEVTAHMENDFVQSRQQGSGVTQDSFHLWLTLARLSAISFGEDQVSIDRWAYPFKRQHAIISLIVKDMLGG